MQLQVRPRRAPAEPCPRSQARRAGLAAVDDRAHEPADLALLRPDRRHARRQRRSRLEIRDRLRGQPGRHVGDRDRQPVRAQGDRPQFKHGPGNTVSVSSGRRSGWPLLARTTCATGQAASGPACATWSPTYGHFSELQRWRSCRLGGREPRSHEPWSASAIAIRPTRQGSTAAGAGSSIAGSAPAVEETTTGTKPPAALAGSRYGRRRLKTRFAFAS